MLCAGLVSMTLYATEPSPAPKELIVLLHGLGRKKTSMHSLEQALKTNPRFEVIALEYPFKEGRFDNQVHNLRAQLHPYRLHSSYTKYHVIGHSLGGLLGLILWSDSEPEQRGRMITIGAPFQGSPWITPGWIYDYALSPLYGDIVSDLLKPEQLFDSYLSVQLNDPSGKMFIAGTYCPLPLKVVSMIGLSATPSDGFVMQDSALACAADRKTSCHLSHQELLSGDCVVQAIQEWLESDVPNTLQ